FPLLPDASTVGSGAVLSGGTAGALAGAGVSGANSVMMQKRMSASQQSGGQSMSSSSGSGSSGGESSSDGGGSSSNGRQAVAATGKVGKAASTSKIGGASCRRSR